MSFKPTKNLRITAKYICYLVIFCAFQFSYTHAELASDTEMTQVCENWLEYIVSAKGSWAGSTEPEIINVQDIKSPSRLLAHCYIISPDGFVVVPVLKELPPIKAYSEEIRLEFAGDFGMAALLRDVLTDRFKKYIEHYGSLEVTQDAMEGDLFDRRNRRTWDIFIQSNESFRRSLNSGENTRLDQVGPLLTTAWHQQAPYNNYCPMGDGNRCVVWCVATALAQILWYHQWPPAGFGNTEYLWNGDQSCGGSTPGRLLRGNFSDRYGYTGTIDEAAEISFEVGMSYNVDYGVCYSIGYALPIFDLLPNNFCYGADLIQLHRNEYTPEEWFAFIQNEINADRPIDYLIFNHMIVADGWATAGEILYYHMNYGWGGANNAWYALDNLYCGWEGCDPMVEVMWTNIYPDRRIMFYADTIAGYAPLEINFAATSDQDVLDWKWDFGDGDSAFLQNPVHTYQSTGIYDVTMTIDIGDSSISKSRADYIYVIDDSLSAENKETNPGETAAIAINAGNIMPLSRIIIPVEYDGELELTFDSCSTAGCRTALFQSVAVTNPDPINKRLIVDMHAWLSGFSDYPYLAEGNGEILRLYFTASSSANPGDFTIVNLDGYDDQQPVFYGSIYGQEHDYHPTPVPGIISLAWICGDANADGIVNILDITYLISYLYKEGPAPVPMEAGDVNNSGTTNILDITYLISFLYKDGPEPNCP